jgi:hypothetical protein
VWIVRVGAKQPVRAPCTSMARGVERSRKAVGSQLTDVTIAVRSSRSRMTSGQRRECRARGPNQYSLEIPHPEARSFACYAITARVRAYSQRHDRASVAALTRHDRRFLTFQWTVTVSGATGETGRRGRDGRG